MFTKLTFSLLALAASIPSSIFSATAEPLYYDQLVARDFDDDYYDLLAARDSDSGFYDDLAVRYAEPDEDEKYLFSLRDEEDALSLLKRDILNIVEAELARRSDTSGGSSTLVGSGGSSTLVGGGSSSGGSTSGGSTGGGSTSGGSSTGGAGGGGIYPESGGSHGNIHETHAKPPTRGGGKPSPPKPVRAGKPAATKPGARARKPGRRG